MMWMQPVMLECWLGMADMLMMTWHPSLDCMCYWGRGSRVIGLVAAENIPSHMGYSCPSLRWLHIALASIAHNQR